MRALIVVQRYGHEVAGGAERHAREFATQLAARGCDIEVLTSRALSYTDWADHYDAGTHELDGVTVHRLSVQEPRHDRLFTPLHARVINGRRPIPFHLQQAWMDMQGPRADGFREWLEARAEFFDLVAFFTYLYWTTWAGLPIASSATTTILHPAAHDEPPIYLPLFDFTFRLPHGFGFLTEEEFALVRRRFGIRKPFVITGAGIDVDATGDEGRFRSQWPQLGDAPYLVYVGRLDPHKGVVELLDYFAAYKARNPGPLRLVFVGEPIVPLPEHPDVTVTGYVGEQTKHDAIEGAVAMVHPSFFESFSIVVAEAWAHGKPTIVQGRCDVLAGQARRSGAGIPYVGFAEFEAAVDLITSDAALRRRLGDNGRRYVDPRYRWDTVIGKYEDFLGALLRPRLAG